MDQDKKVKLDELPEEGSSSFQGPTDLRSISKELEPRIQKLKKLDTAAQVNLMDQKWRFDKEVWTFGWLAYILILFAINQSGYHKGYFDERGVLRLQEFGLGGQFMQSIYGMFDFIVKYPIFLAVLAPLFFRLRKGSEFFMDISFEGLSTVKRVNLKENDMPLRVFFKWSEVHRVEKVKSGRRVVLKLYSQEDKLGEMIWDFDQSKKRALKILLNGHIHQDHPIRIFLEKDVK